MGYVSQTEFKLFLADSVVDKLTQFAGASVASGSAKLDQLIDWESSELDSLLAAEGYTVPLTTVPSVVKKTVAVRVAKTLYASNGETVPTSLNELYDQSLAEVFYIISNRAKLPGLNPSTTDGPGGSYLHTSSGSLETDFDDLYGTFL